MYAVSASRTMKNARPKHVESDVIVRDILQIREERRREAERRKEEARLAQIAAYERTIDMYRKAEEQRLRDTLAEAQLRRAEYLADLTAGRMKRTHTFREIERRTMKLFRLRKHELYSNRRNRELVFARQFLMYWAYRLTRLSLPQIGKLMGGFDHTTIMAGRRAYRKKRFNMGRSVR